MIALWFFATLTLPPHGARCLEALAHGALTVPATVGQTGKANALLGKASTTSGSCAVVIGFVASAQLCSVRRGLFEDALDAVWVPSSSRSSQPLHVDRDVILL